MAGKTEKMCTYFHLHDSFGGSASISLKELLFCVDLSSHGAGVKGEQKLKGNGSKDTGWLEKQRKYACTFICVIHLVVLSLFV